MKSRKVYGALAVALTATIAVSGCSSSNSSSGGSGAEKQDTKDASKLVSINKQDRSNLEQGGTLTLPLDSMPVNWNTWNSDGNQSEINTMLQATDPNMYNVAPDGTYSPDPDYMTKMPEVKEVGGKEVVTYTLNPKAKWNDGTPIDYTAFQATWNANKAPMEKGGFNNNTTTGYENIEKVEKGAQPNEVVVTFKEKFYPATEVFGGLVHPKVGNDAKVFNDGYTNNQFHNEWRAGAFIIQSSDTTTKTVTLVPNPKWWGEKPLLDKIIYRQMEDSASIPAFKNGEIDMTATRNKSRYTQIQGAKDLDIRRSQRLFTAVYSFNSKAQGLSDVNVRKALWQAFDRSEWRKIRFDGVNWSEPDLGSNFYYGFQPEYQDNYPISKPSASDAQKTLQDAGYTKGADGFFSKGGQKLTVKYTTFGDDPTTTALARLAQNQAKAAGIDLQIDTRAASAFAQSTKDKDFGIIAMGWTPGSSSPLTSVCQLMCSDGSGNYAFAGDPAIDARIKKLGSISDKTQQSKEINSIEKDWMTKTYGTMPLASGPQIWAVRKGLANYGPEVFANLNMHWENVGWQKGMKKG